VSPTGQTLLFDTGTGGDGNRDADRITNLVKRVAVEPQLDHVIVSHYHGDHAGNAAELSRRFPIRHFYDHGAWTVEGQPSRRAAFDSYLTVRATSHATVPKPGTRIPITGFDFIVVSSAGDLVTTPLAGMPRAGEANQHCREFVPRLQDATPENAEAIGGVVRYGNFTLLDLSDLIWDMEKDLVCPNNLIGAVDVYHTSRHGTDWAGNPVMVHAVRPRVAVMNNGARKGGTKDTFEILRRSPGLADIWQLHYAEMASADTNAPGMFIANLEGNPGHQGHYIKLSARTDGGFTMTNERNGFTKEYPAPGRARPRAAATAKP
jgi:beta-lactamase superfamily II metal-dependent hydrolase